MINEPDLGEQALGKVAEIALKSQLDDAEQIAVDIRTDPLKLVQGKVDSVAISGEGMVMKQELRAEAVEINTGAVAIDPFKAIAGQIELTAPTNAEAQILLTEADLNRALDSDYLRNKLKNIEMQVRGEPVVIDIQQAHIGLPGDEQVALDVDLLLHGANEVQGFSALAKPLIKENGHRIDLEVISAEGRGISLEFITALFERVEEVLDLRSFDLGGMTLQLKNLVAQKGKLVLQAVTTIEQLPSQ